MPAVDRLVSERRRLGHTCTGIAAVWCPNHGDCICPDDDAYPDAVPTRDSATCPLHGPASDHPRD